MRYEVEQGIFLLFVPILIGIGVLIYFSLPREPQIWALAFALILSYCLSRIQTKMPQLGKLALASCFIFLGAFVAKIHADFQNPKMLSHSMTAQISGEITKREIRADKSARYWIKVETYDKKQRQNLPQTIRVTARKTSDFGNIGDKVSGLVRLRAPSGPMLPKNYDFTFHGFFEGIGGIGFFMGKPRFEKSTQSAELYQSLMQLRSNLRQHIEMLLPQNQASLVTALIIGDRSGISKSDNLALRRSGLAHILAISGLHMALLSATLFFLIRSLLALSPYLVAHYPIKKWAAVAALGASSFYFLISGAGIATQRAYIMLVIMLLAILVNRKALTLRNVAIAASFILLISPQAILAPGFQMSFAAVVALIACYELLLRRRENSIDEFKSNEFKPYELSQIKRNMIAIWRFFIGIITTSIIAGLTTGLFAAFHFHQVASFGLFANTLAMPIVTILVMPLALISVMFIPFALDEPFFHLMGQSVEWVMDIAYWIEGIQPSGNVGQISVFSILCFTLALLCFAIFKTRLKLLSVPFLLFSMFAIYNKSVPLAIIGEDPKILGIINAEQLDLLNPKKSKFQTSNWAKAFQLTAATKSSFICDEMGCVYKFSPDQYLSIAYSPNALIEDCKRAKIIIHGVKKMPSCNDPNVLEISYKALKQQGTHVISQQDEGFRIKTAYGRFPRPWTAHRFKN